MRVRISEQILKGVQVDRALIHILLLKRLNELVGHCLLEEGLDNLSKALLITLLQVTQDVLDELINYTVQLLHWFFLRESLGPFYLLDELRIKLILWLYGLSLETGI